MKISKLIALVLAAALLATLFAGCKSNPLKPYAGTYLGQTEKLVGDDTVEAIDYKLVLADDGTGTHSRDGLTLKITWTLDGENFTMQETFLGMGLDYTGTLKADGSLVIYNGDPTDDWTYIFTYAKQ